jgi:hypothetical protein
MTWNFRKHYVDQYNVSVRFLATQGGLSRWQHILDLAEGELYVQKTIRSRRIKIKILFISSDNLEIFIIVQLRKFGTSVQYYIVI